MNNTQTLNRDLETIAWAVFFVWFGLTDSDIGLVRTLPHGTSTIGIGMILLGLNAVRWLNGIPTSGLTLTLGVTALALGGLALARSLLNLPFDLPVFAIFLIVLGVIVLARKLVHVWKTGLADSH